MNIFQIKSAADTIQKIQSVTITSKGPLDLADVTEVEVRNSGRDEISSFRNKKIQNSRGIQTIQAYTMYSTVPNYVRKYA